MGASPLVNSSYGHANNNVLDPPSLLGLVGLLGLQFLLLSWFGVIFLKDCPSCGPIIG